MNESVEQLYPHTPEAVRAIIKRVRTMVQAAIPEATEIFYHGAFGYGTTASGFDRIIYIAPQNGYVNLGFFFGSHLHDPTHLLEGSGMRMCHVKIKTVQAADSPSLRQLVRDAWTDGVVSVAQLHTSRRRGGNQAAL